jgi:transposase
MTTKTNTTAYTMAQAKDDLTNISKNLAKAIDGAEKARADVAMKLSKAGHSNANITKLFNEMGIKISETTIGRDVIVAKVLEIEKDLDFTTVTKAIRDGKETGVTIPQLKKIVNAPKATKAEKRSTLAEVIPSVSKSQVKNSPRAKVTIAKEQLDKMVKWVNEGSLEVEDLASLLSETLSEIGYELDSE